MTGAAITANPWKETVAAARANFLPGLVLQLFALSLVLAYYFHPATHAALDVLAASKARFGLAYSFFATGLCGGIIPSLVLLLVPRTRAVTPISHMVFLTLFWAYKGLEVDMMYRGQSLMFGDLMSFTTILKKVLVDQFVFTAFWSAPTTLLVFHWKESGFRFASLREINWITYLRLNLPKALLATWVIWIPGVAIIYSLPPTLQIPLFNIVLCFFSLLYVTLTRKKALPGD